MRLDEREGGDRWDDLLVICGRNGLDSSGCRKSPVLLRILKISNSQCNCIW